MKAKDVEAKLNQRSDGWELDWIIDADTFGFVSGSKDVLLMVFKR